MRVLALNGLLGYGYGADSLSRAFRPGPPDALGVDAGSTDPGPSYLGSGKSFTNRQAVKRDLAGALPLARAHGVPFLIGTAGGAGGNVHVDWLRGIIEEVARERGLRFRMAVIRTEPDRAYLKAKLRAGKIRPLGPQLEATERSIDESVRIVSQIGIDPFIRALDEGAEVILAGRACDTALYAAPAIRAGFDPGLAFHMAKIMECGCLCAEPQSAADVLSAVIDPDGFTLEPANPARRCTVEKVAAHTLYEQADPCRIVEPDGVADVSGAVYTQVSDRAVRVSGSRFLPAAVKTLKIEGVRQAGFRAISIAGVKDPATIRVLDRLFEDTREHVRDNLPAGTRPESYRLRLRRYGADLPADGAPPPAGDWGLILDTVADSQELADTVCALARSRLLHADYPGRKTTAGNLAFPYSPSDIALGPVYTFSLYHVIEVDDLSETASFEWVEAGGPA